MEVKGYNVSVGYMGYVNGNYILFASESDYLDYVADILVDSREN